MGVKRQDEKVFDLSGDIRARCWWEKTRNGFRHLAILFVSWKEQSRVKVCYQNRTWEEYRYQSVLKKLVENSELSESDKKKCIKEIKKPRKTESFKALKGVLAIGNLLNIDESKENQNKFKVRMIKAQFENCGIDFPDDWDTLSEDEKEKRLAGIESIL